MVYENRYFGLGVKEPIVLAEVRNRSKKLNLTCKSVN